VGRSRLAQVLKGSTARDMHLYAGARNLGKFSTLPLKEIEGLILQLLEGGYLKPEGGDRPTLKLTPAGEAALQTRAALPVKVRGLRDPGHNGAGRAEAAARPAHDRRLPGLAAQRRGGPTAQVTGELQRQGRSPEQIAAERGLTLGTVYSHLAQLIADGSLDINAVVPAGVQAQVRAAIDAEGSLQYLAPLKARLPDSLDYAVIRCVVNAVALERGEIPARR
jgi:hypothetical protein